MHSLSIKYKDGLDENELRQKFYHVRGSLRENGQTNGRDMKAYIKNNRISIDLWIFTEEALDQKYFTKYVIDAIEKLEEFCGNKIEIKYVGYVEEELESGGF